MKTENEILKIVENIAKGYIKGNVVYELIRKMYNEKHSEILENKVRLFLGKKDKILFSEFQKIVLDFQLISHEKYLTKMVNQFHQFDLNSKGFIDRIAFLNLLKSMDVEEHEAKEILNSADPFKTNIISFSDCISIFAAHLVDDPKRKNLSLLEKFCSPSE